MNELVQPHCQSIGVRGTPISACAIWLEAPDPAWRILEFEIPDFLSAYSGALDRYHHHDTRWESCSFIHRNSSLIYPA